MRHILLLTTFFVLLTVGALAGTRTKEEMKEAAMRVLVKNSAARGMTKSASSSELKEYLSKEKLSIIGSEDLGFAVVTSDDRFDDVIGYSTTSFTDTIPCGFEWWLKEAERVMNKESVKPAAARTNRVSVNGSVAPLMKTEWGQDNPFNAQLRYTINGNSYQFITGCVATAMAQVMKYHEYPEKSQGSIEYVVWNFMAKMSHTFGDTYDWKNMLDKYNYQIYGSLDAPAKAVSILMRDCGMAVEMNYGPKSVGSSASSSKIAPGLITYFSYDSKGTKLYKRSDYQKDTWMQMIYDELKAGRPIIYNGRVNRDPDEPTGHSFVIHGYDSTGKVYINWGGQGAYDGYFDIDMLNVDQHEYNDNQDMVFVKPGSGLTTTYTLSISSSGNGQVTYSSNAINNTTKSFTINEGTSPTLTFTPNTGYQVKSVKVNNVDVTSSVSNNKYTINNINQNTEVSVTFEAIPVTSYTLSISTTGNGQVTYLSNTINNTTKSFTVNEGTSATFTFTPNTGYRLKSVKVNNVDVTSSISNNKYAISSISQNTTINVVFESMSSSMYTITVNSHDDYGYTEINGVVIKNGSQEFTVSEGENFIVTAVPNEGYRVSQIRTKKEGYAASLFNYTDNSSKRKSEGLYNVKQNGTIDVYFEKIPAVKPQYTITVNSHDDYGYTEINGVVIRNGSQEFTVSEGENFIVTAVPNEGYRVSQIRTKKEGFAASLFNYTDDSSKKKSEGLYNIKQNGTIDVYFEKIPAVRPQYTITVNSHDEYGYTEINGVVVKNSSQEFTVSEGENFIVTAVPNEGYRVSQIRTKKEGFAASLFNYTDDSSKRKSEGLYNIKQNGTIDVYFEKIEGLPQSYSLTISSSGSGYVSYLENNISETTKSFTLDTNASATLTFIPNSGYQLKSVMVNNVDVTSNVSNNKYTIININKNTSVEVVFEAESNNALVDNYPVQSAQFDLINGKVVFVSNWSEFSYYALTQKLDNMTKEYFDANYEPDLLATNIGTTSDGYSIDQLKIFKSFTLKGDANASNDLGIAPYYSNWQGTTNHRFTWVLTADELERLTNNQSSPVQITRYVRYKEKSKISPRPKYPYIYIKMTVNLTRKASYTLSIQSTGNGSVSYDGTIIRDSKKTFNVVDGNSVTISLAPDNGYRIKSVEVNSLDVTSSISNNQYSINNISKNTSVNVAFEPDTNTNSVLSCSDLSCYTSSSPTLKVNLQNMDEVKLCQFDLRLPNGVKVAKKSNGKLNATLTERADGHSISSSQLTNGDYRFIISSMSNDSFMGNSGTLVEITLDIPATMTSGEYAVKVMNVELSVPNGNDLRVVKPKDTDSKLTIVSYKPGDVNNDGSVSVTDVGCVINYILEQVPSTFIFGAADMNSDGEISVTDVGIIINQILSGEASSRKYTSQAIPLSGHMRLLPIADGYQLTFENMDAFIGLQFDMEGADLDDIQLIGGNNHLMACRELSNGKYRVVCYSPTNSAFIPLLANTGLGSSLLKISSVGDVVISNIHLTTSNFAELRPSALSGTKTGIACVRDGLQISVQGRTLFIISDHDVTIPVISFGGTIYRTLQIRQGENKFDGMRAGVYMIDNNKILIR